MDEKIDRININELLEFSIINVDKPSDYTSHDVVAKIKKIFNANKVGHCGTLDPMVTGVLPILINKATKLSNYFMKKEKIYIGKMYLHSDISKERLEEEMDKFIGKIMQKPPVKSRVKREVREREVMEFKILKMNKRVVEFSSRVEAGTYIRKLISDLGEKIGGAHMTELRRIKAGIFEIKDSHKIEDIEKAYNNFKENGDESKLREILIFANIVDKIVPKIKVKEPAIKGLLNGKPLMKNDLEENIKLNERFSIFNNNKLIGIYKKVDEESIIARPEFVLN